MMDIPTHKIVVVGDGAVGKTCLLHSYCQNRFPDKYEPTVFDNYSCNIFIDGKAHTLTLWDTAGQEDFDRLRPLSYPQTDIFLVCFSLINPVSLQNVRDKWLPELQQARVQNDIPRAVILFVGTKSDLHDSPAHVDKLATCGKAVVNEDEAKELAAKAGARYVRCSALTRVGLKEVFDTAIRETYAPSPKPKQSRVTRVLQWIAMATLFTSTGDSKGGSALAKKRKKVRHVHGLPLRVYQDHACAAARSSA
jgi:small GTP-binding protein